MRSLIAGRCAVYRQAVHHFAVSRALASPQNAIDDRRMLVAALYDSMEKDVRLILSHNRNSFVKLASALEPLNPLSMIKRGYSAVYTDEGELIKSVRQIEPGRQIHFQLSDGDVAAKVEKVMIKEKKDCGEAEN